MVRKVDPIDAERVMRAAGCIPLTPYPGSSIPWPCIHEPCGQAIAPSYGTVRSRGRACRQCGSMAGGAKRRAGLAAAAEAAMRAAGFEPLEPYPGGKKPWRCIHLRCGQERTPTLDAVRAHRTACRECSLKAAGRTVWSAESAVAAFRENGLQPLEPWPGSSSKPWRARHIECGRVVRPRLGNVAAGQGPCRECGQEAAHAALRMDHEEAAVLFRSAGLEPLVPFPGVDRPWRSRHDQCGAEVAPTYTNVKRGQGGCINCGAKAGAERLRMPEEDARAVMLRHELVPVEPYPGSARPWKSRHSCGRVVTPTLSNVASGKGICRYCHSAFPFDGPAILYLVVDRDAVKIGCANRSGKRLAEHTRFGWQIAWTIDTPTGDDAYNLEQGILEWWRDELGLPPAYPAELLPQYGYTETARWDDMHPLYVLAKVESLAEAFGLPLLRLRPGLHFDARPEIAVSGLGARARAKRRPMDQPTLIDL